MNRTSTYVMSVDPTGDLSPLKELRSQVSRLNKHTRTKHYVKCQGRWGENNPKYNHRIIPFCPLADAVKWDVYVYER